MWSSADQLRRQVAAAGPMYLCPLFRERKGSYRSGLWFTPAEEARRSAVLLVDVRKEVLSDLPKVSAPVELKRFIIGMFGGVIAGCSFEDIW